MEGEADQRVGGSSKARVKISAKKQPLLSAAVEKLRELSKADVLAAITERRFELVAAKLERATDFESEKQEAGFADAVSKWRQAYVKSQGKVVGEVWMRGPEHGYKILLNDFAGQWEWRGKLDADAACLFTHANGGGEWKVVSPASAEDWRESFVEVLRNPSLPREDALRLNADAIYMAAQNGDVRFFERVSETFRKRNRKRQAVASAAHVLLRYWIPAGLWRLKMREGRARLNAMADKTENVGVRAYEKAKERLGL